MSCRETYVERSPETLVVCVVVFLSILSEGSLLFNRVASLALLVPNFSNLALLSMVGMKANWVASWHFFFFGIHDLDNICTLTYFLDYFILSP